MASNKTMNEQKVSFFSIIGSVIAAAFGVQTKANRERDFQRGKIHHFVFAGILFAVVFVFLLVGLVKIIMYYATL